MMIPKNELRIGNWVVNKSGEFYKIATGVEIDDAHSLTPIVMTDNILHQCGFAFHDYFKMWQKPRNLPQAGSEIEMDGDYNLRDFSHKYIGVQIKNLHQLQNIFFQLKGTELEINDLATRPKDLADSRVVY